MAEPQAHWCDVCGRCFTWTRAASWYGSIRALDDYGARGVVKCCCAECSRVVRERGEPRNLAAVTAMKHALQAARPTGLPRMYGASQ